MESLLHALVVFGIHIDAEGTGIAVHIVLSLPASAHPTLVTMVDVQQPVVIEIADCAKVSRELDATRITRVPPDTLHMLALEALDSLHRVAIELLQALDLPRDSLLVVAQAAAEELLAAGGFQLAVAAIMGAS